MGLQAARLGLEAQNAVALRLMRLVGDAIRRLAATRNEGRARNDSNKCPFRKRNASGGFRLSRRITVHGCSSLVAAAQRKPRYEYMSALSDCTNPFDRNGAARFTVA